MYIALVHLMKIYERIMATCINYYQRLIQCIRHIFFQRVPLIYPSMKIKICIRWADLMEGIKSYQSCLEELRESTCYNEHMELGNKFIARTYDEIIRVLADVMILNEDDTVTINQKSYPHI